MRETGQTSGKVNLWMVHADTVAFGDDLAQALGGTAIWRRIMPGKQIGPMHERLGEILPEWESGAILRLKSGGPILQYLQGMLMRSYGHPITAPEPGALLMSSELAWVWVPERESPEHRETFPALVKSAKAALLRHTAPNRVLRQGKPYRASRLGPHAEAYVREHQLQLRDIHWMGTDIVLAPR